LPGGTDGAVTSGTRLDRFVGERTVPGSVAGSADEPGMDEIVATGVMAVVPVPTSRVAGGGGAACVVAGGGLAVEPVAGRGRLVVGPGVVGGGLVVALVVVEGGGLVVGAGVAVVEVVFSAVGGIVDVVSLGATWTTPRIDWWILH
jgi:hypothetical protein